MSKFEVTITHNQSYSATVEVDADDEEEAGAKARQIAEDDANKETPELNWALEDSDFEVDDVNELDEDDDDEEE